MGAEMLTIILITSLFVLVLSIFLFKKSKRSKKLKILVTGRKSTGKTKLINFLINKECDTVPTLFDYSVENKNFIFTESRKTENFEKFDFVIFMIKKDLPRIESRKNLISCSFEENFEGKNNVICLNKDISKISEILTRLIE